MSNRNEDGAEAEGENGEDDQNKEVAKTSEERRIRKVSGGRLNCFSVQKWPRLSSPLFYSFRGRRSC